MKLLQDQDFGCQELNLNDTKEVNGGFLTLFVNNNSGVISAGALIDTNTLTNGLPLTGNLPIGNLNGLLSPVTNLLGGLLGGNLLRL